jgi:hypothetical protein
MPVLGTSTLLVVVRCSRVAASEEVSERLLPRLGWRVWTMLGNSALE